MISIYFKKNIQKIKKKLDDNLESQLNVIKEDQYNLTQRKQCDIADLEYNILNNQS